MDTATKSWTEGAGQEVRKSFAGSLWLGRVLSALAVVGLLMSAAMKISHSPQVVDVFVHKFGFDESALFPIGVLEFLCVLLYTLPRTSVLGAIVLTGYLGGAIVTHVRVADAWVSPLILGVVVWAGLFLRDRKLRELIPLRRSERTA